MQNLSFQLEAGHTGKGWEIQVNSREGAGKNKTKQTHWSHTTAKEAENEKTGTQGHKDNQERKKRTNGTSGLNRQDTGETHQ